MFLAFCRMGFSVQLWIIAQSDAGQQHCAETARDGTSAAWLPPSKKQLEDKGAVSFSFEESFADRGRRMDGPQE